MCIYVGLFCIYIGLFYIYIGLFCINISLLCIYVGLFYIYIGLFYIYIGLFCINVGLFYIYISLFCIYTPLQGSNVESSPHTATHCNSPLQGSDAERIGIVDFGFEIVIGYILDGRVREHTHTHLCMRVCCSVLQRVAVCCSVLQCVAVCCSVMQCVASHYKTLCNTRQHTTKHSATHCIML